MNIIIPVIFGCVMTGAFVVYCLKKGEEHGRAWRDTHIKGAPAIFIGAIALGILVQL